MENVVAPPHSRSHETTPVLNALANPFDPPPVSLHASPSKQDDPEEVKYHLPQASLELMRLHSALNVQKQSEKEKNRLKRMEMRQEELDALKNIFEERLTVFEQAD